MADWPVAIVGGTIATVVGGLILYSLIPPQQVPTRPTDAAITRPPPTGEPDKAKPETSDDPRRELASLGVPFSKEGWDKAVYNGDARSLKLLLRAGYKPFSSAGYGVSSGWSQAGLSNPEVKEVFRSIRDQVGKKLCALNHCGELYYAIGDISMMGADEFKFYCPNYVDAVSALQKRQYSKEYPQGCQSLIDNMRGRVTGR